MLVRRVPNTNTEHAVAVVGDARAGSAGTCARTGSSSRRCRTAPRAAGAARAARCAPAGSRRRPRAGSRAGWRAGRCAAARDGRNAFRGSGSAAAAGAARADHLASPAASSAADMVSKSMRCRISREEKVSRASSSIFSVPLAALRFSLREQRVGQPLALLLLGLGGAAVGLAAAAAASSSRRASGRARRCWKAWSKIGRCSSRESSTADMVQYQSSRRSGNWCAPVISSARTQSSTRSGPMRRPAARSRRAKCMTFSARPPGGSRSSGGLPRRRALACELLYRSEAATRCSRK